MADDAGLARTVRWVALLNLAYFGVEFAVARGIGSVSLFADSIDFLEDAAVNLLILVALAVNLFCAGLLARFRHASGSLTRAAFLSARNDAIANVAIIGAGFATRLSDSVWPDLAVGLGIFLMNLDAAREVWEAAREEHASATAGSPIDSARP